MVSNDKGFRLTTEELNELGMKRNGKRVLPTVRQMQEENLGIGTSIPEYYINKFQELAGERQLTAEDVAMCFRAYLHLGEETEAQRHMALLLGNILREYLEWKDSRGNE